MNVLVTQSCPILCYPMDCSLLGSPVPGILQAGILEWVAMSFFRGSSRPKDRTRVSRTAGSLFTTELLSIEKSECNGPEAGVLEAGKEQSGGPQRVPTSAHRPLALGDVNGRHGKAAAPAVL